ncbi:MAG: HPt (histidine-containing phosphotransfer) domain-containing protein [Chlamydiales bacterium]|jgi:HPt (histidine-containing phosphotransfer) domain-containing protein
MTVEALSTLVQRRHSDAHGGQPVIDVAALQTLQDLVGDDDGEFLLEVVDMYLQDALQRVQNMQGAVHDLDWDAVAKDAHSLKSASANVGALPFAKNCAQLECAIREHAEVQMLPQATRVAAMFEDVRHVLAHLQSCLGA